MSYEPKEGVDYITDFYAAAGVPREAAPDEIRDALNQRAKEYHPDRLAGLAPEFQRKGEQMIRILNKARGILLDEDKRSQYDDILNDWDGPVSQDDTPIITKSAWEKARFQGQSPDEVEEIFSEQKKQIAAAIGFKPKRAEELEALMEQMGEQVPDVLRAQYEDALLEHDRMLAIEEAERAQLLGIDTAARRYNASIGYREKIAGELEASREEYLETQRMHALGGVSTKLALLSGEITQEEAAALPAVPEIALPVYFEDQAQKVQVLAKEREDILQRRLNNFRPTYPEAELQQDAREKFVVGMITENDKGWWGIQFDTEAIAVNQVDLPEEIRALLDNGDFKAAIEQGWNIVTFSPLEQIDPMDLLNTTIERYIEKYFPELAGE